MTREELMALADELESCGPDCDECPAFEQAECRGYRECAENVARYCARRIREMAGHDACEDTTVSAYDLLGDDDREALAWVRDHGGLEAVKASIHQGAMEHGCLLKIAHALGTSIYDGTSNADALLEKLEKRLMPKGMEWPKVDGKPVVIGERMRSCGIDDCKVVGIDPAHSRLTLASDNIEEGKATYFTDFAEDCHRPMPKAFDADGVEICVGDRLYDTDTGCGRTVRAVNDNGTVEFDGHENRGWFGWFLIHRAPVLAADGEPLEVGQTVWNVNNGMEFTVSRLPKPGAYQAVEVRYRNGSSTSFDPDRLTHERPESWERIEEDATKNPFDYCKDVGHRLDTCENSEAYKARDLVRRARKLAEKED